METKAFIISIIKKKKELSGIGDDFIQEMLDKYIERNPSLWKKIANHPKIEKSRELKILVKDIRKPLREIHGVFHIDLNKRNKLLAELEAIVKNKASNKIVMALHKKILLTHKSTMERLDHYKVIYSKIFKLTGKPSSILDIGSGLNPLSIIFMDLKDVRYIAVELTDEDCIFLNKYFKIMNINGIAVKKDLLKNNNFPKSDICFMFKILDSLESMKRNITKDIFSRINSKFIIVSFPKKTLSGKELSTKRLSWFRKIARSYKEFEVENEIFYIIQKNK